MSIPTLRQIDRQLTNDIDRLQAVRKGAPGYSVAVEGKLPTPNAAIEVLDALPPGKGRSDKFVYEIAHDTEVVGCLEMVRGYPETDIAFIGLLLFREGSRDEALAHRFCVSLKQLGRFPSQTWISDDA
ncbi:hypothetical protein [Paraburkholderia terricola]|uniref:hypothetical protein n=1 Tax=Paraburkholderia terricola TaxID=169427 RepID=UPI001FC8F197|nr:hypothetical protein [Paraburkholderia terricola]